MQKYCIQNTNYFLFKLGKNIRSQLDFWKTPEKERVYLQCLSVKEMSAVGRVIVFDWWKMSVSVNGSSSLLTLYLEETVRVRTTLLVFGDTRF